jgi:hypothetical protein
MAKIDDLISEIDDLLCLNGKQNTLIRNAAHRALQHIETAIDFRYMQRYEAIDLFIDRNIPAPPFFKRIDYVRYFAPQNLNQYVYVRPIYTLDQEYLGEGLPTAVWFDGFDYMWFDYAPTDKPLLLEVFYFAFSDWAEVTTQDNHPVWLRIPNLLFYKTIIEVAIATRKREIASDYAGLLRDEMQIAELQAQNTHEDAYNYQIQAEETR